MYCSVHTACSGTQSDCRGAAERDTKPKPRNRHEFRAAMAKRRKARRKAA